MASTTFPNQIPDYSNVRIISRNNLPPRADFSVNHALSLNGEWRFSLHPNPFAAPKQEGVIRVPGHWQMQRYGNPPQYINVSYPYPVDPPNISFSFNETGVYQRQFSVPHSWSNAQIRLRFEGVDSAFHVTLNGVAVGYSQGARNPAEFDITRFLKSAEDNALSVTVYKYSDGSYLERQDQWSMSGIFRDVLLLPLPLHETRIEDFVVQTLFDESFIDATLKVSVITSAAEKVTLQLLDHDGVLVIEATTDDNAFSLPIKSPHPWTAETPYLYTLTLSVPAQTVASKVGFRSISLHPTTNALLVNGKPIKIRGVNRHEHSPTGGRAVPYELLRQDLLNMKRHNINAIRTSHQPNDRRMLDFADELGFWVIAEADLETHGFGEIEELVSDDGKADERAAQWTTSNPDWKEAYIDRAKQLVSRDKNHPSVIFWSLGNEAFWGSNFKAMYEYIKETDPTRLVHYEQDHEGESVDILSQMYSGVSKIRDYASKHDEPFPPNTSKKRKPLLLCEFAHAMGNGPGGLKEYVDTFYEYDLLIGGLVWEWANHGLLAIRDGSTNVISGVGRVPTPEEIDRWKSLQATGGKDYTFLFAYGGDFTYPDTHASLPHDSNFVMDGLCRSDHSPGRGLLEYKKVIEPVQVLSHQVPIDSTSVQVKIVNRYDFLNLDHLACYATWILDGLGLGMESNITIPPGIRPHQSAFIPIHVPNSVIDLQAQGEELLLTLSFRLKQQTNWAPSNFEVAWGQVHCVWNNPLTLRLPTPVPSREVLQLSRPDLHSLCVISGPSSFTFDVTQGLLTSWRKDSHELLAKPPKMDFYRPLTDNDRLGADGKDWITRRVHQTDVHFREATWSDSTTTSGEFTITIKARIAPPVLDWSVQTTATYTVRHDGILDVNIVGIPEGRTLPKVWPRIGVTFELNVPSDSLVKWYGLGPVESYPDKSLAARTGVWSHTIDTMFDEWVKVRPSPIVLFDHFTENDR